MRRVYIGYDSREDEAYRIAAHSIIRHASVPVEIIPLDHRDLRRRNLFTRPWYIQPNGQFVDERDQRPFSTEFAHSRFLVPELERRRDESEKFVLFVDCDILCLGDIEELFELADPNYAVQVVKHPNYYPHISHKMDGMAQLPYSRKLWSSLILWNVSHAANLDLGILEANNCAGHYLHNFQWLMDKEIGELPPEWNYIPGKTEAEVVPLGDTNFVVKEPKIIHYTEGGPWFKEYRDCLMGDKWLNEREHYKQARKLWD